MRISTPRWLFALLCSQSAGAQSVAPASSEARVAAVHGAAVVSGPGVTERALAVGDVLHRGDRVRTRDDGIVRLAFLNGASLTLLPNGQVVMFSDGSQPAGGRPPSVSTTLTEGTVRVTGVQDTTAVVPFAAAATTLGLGRGDAVISVNHSHNLARIAVHTGRVHIRTGSNSRVLREATGVHEAFRGPHRPANPLLGAPSWRDAPPSHIPSLRGTTMVAATYGLDGAAGWRIETSRDPSFQDVLTSERVPAVQTRWSSRVEGAGDWYVRVAAVDSDGLEGPFTQPAKFTVEVPRVEPGVAAVAGAPARSAFFRAPVGLWCGVDGQRLTQVREPIALAPARSHQVRCATTERGDDAEVIEISATTAGPLNHTVHIHATGGPAHILALRLSDLSGLPIPYANVVVTGPAGVRIGEIRESPERGVYTAPVQWSGALTHIALRFVINGELQFTEEVAVNTSIAP
jgi:hypothetical protein